MSGKDARRTVVCVDHKTFHKKYLIYSLVVVIITYVVMNYFNSIFSSFCQKAFNMGRNTSESLFDVIWIALILTVIYFVSRPALNMAESRGNKSVWEEAQTAEHRYGMMAKKLDKYFSSRQELNKIINAHLNDIVKSTDTASFEVISKLKSIDGSITSMAETLTRLKSESAELSDESRNTIEENDKTLKTLRGYVTQRLDETEKDYTLGTELSSKSNKMAGLTDLLKDISDQTNLLALNAAIEAARAGNMGRGFAVVADAVRTLSQKSNDATIEIGTAITEVAGMIKDRFQADITKQVHDKEHNLLVGFVARLDAIGEGFKKLSSFNDNVIREVAVLSKEVERKILEALSNIQFQDITRQQIEQLIKTNDTMDEYMKKLQELLNSPIVLFDDSIIDFNIDDMLKDYVMKKQHHIHKTAIQASGKGHAPDSKHSEAESEITFF